MHSLPSPFPQLTGLPCAGMTFLVGSRASIASDCAEAGGEWDSGWVNAGGSGLRGGWGAILVGNSGWV